jgi:plastocyanin
MKRPMLPRRCCFAFAVVLASAMSAVSAHAETIRIVMDKLVYAPVEAKAAVGDTIEWVNSDILAHTATARNGDWDVTIAAKKTVTLVLKKAGTIDYYCRYHPNMEGRIVVAPK